MIKNIGTEILCLFKCNLTMIAFLLIKDSEKTFSGCYIITMKMPISGKLHQRNNTDLIDNKDKNIKKINKLKKTNNNFKQLNFINMQSSVLVSNENSIVAYFNRTY